MRAAAASIYISPTTQAPLQLIADQSDGEQVIQGSLIDTQSGERFPIVRGIPRFVGSENYADSFGFQWNRYRQIQLDSFNGSTLTKDRFLSGTGWTPEALKGKRVLEAGCGAGRFSEVILDCGAELYSFDYSNAVDAARENHRTYPNWEVAQADIFAIPFPLASFDYVFCYGVIQHTPDPKRAFLNLTRYLKPGGQIAMDVYQRPDHFGKLMVKYWYRPLAKRIPKQTLMRVLEGYLPAWLPFENKLVKLRKIGPFIACWVPCWNKSTLPLPDDMRLQWTILDTFDALSCEYDSPQTLEAVQQWFREAGLPDAQVTLGGNGVEGRATR